AWAALTSSRRLEESRKKARAATFASFGITRHFQEALMGLNDRLLKLATYHDTNEWTRFESDWAELNQWIDDQHLSAPTERNLLDQINAAYDDYHAAAQRMAAKLATDARAGLRTAEFSQLQTQTGRLLDFASLLGEAHRETMRLALSGSN